MQRNCLLLICLGSACHGRRVQTSSEHLRPLDDTNESHREINVQQALDPPLFQPTAAFNAHSRGAFFPETSHKEGNVQLPSSIRLAALPDTSLAMPNKQAGLGCVTIRMSVDDASKDNVEAKKRILESTRQNRGPNHPETLLALNNYADTISKDGRQAEAKAVLKEALELTRQVLGPKHPETVRALKNYEEMFGVRPVVSALVKLGLKGYYRNIAVGAALVAGVLWLLRFVTEHLDSLARTFGPVGVSCASPAAAVVAGFWAGALHTLSGPDHLAALAPLALRKKNPIGAFRTGVFWGIAHVVGQVLLGLSLLAASRSNFVMDTVSKLGLAAVGEQLAAVAIGIVLIAIGALGFKEIQEWEDGDDTDAHDTSSGRLRTFITGMLAGMQPDALLFCLPALTLPSRLAGICFLSAFGGGTLLSMGGFTAALQAACISFGQQAVKRVAAFSSVVAITLGVALCGAAIGIPLLRGFF